jgi:hypothetical protein
VGGDGITVNANDVEVDSTVIRTTGNFSLAGDIDFAGIVDLQDEIVASGIVTNSSTGTINNASTAGASIVRFTGSTARNLTGLANGTDGKRVILMNASGTDLTLNGSSSSSSVGNRFLLSASNETIQEQKCVEVVYDGTTSVWRVLTRFAST